MPARPPRSLIAYLAIVYGCSVLFLTGIIPSWGRWYSTSKHYESQVNALLRGDLALSHNPLDCEFDLAWSEGGVHQVWGLGVPLWRAPFVAAARLLGFQNFPDHVATAVAFTAVALLVLVTFVRSASSRNEIYCGVGVALILLVFPPFLHLLNSSFSVYEEAVAYAYIYAILEFALLIRFLRKLSLSNGVVLALVAGFGGLIRPTLVFYGMASWLIGTLAIVSTFSAEATWRSKLFSLVKSKLWILFSLFSLVGIAVLLVTNQLRFGSPTEFGHKLNLQDIYGSLYATRFDHPMERASIPTAVTELMGALFLMEQGNDGEFFASNKFAGQAELPRMRHLVFVVYNWSFALLVLLGIIVTARFLLSSCNPRTRGEGEGNVWGMIGLWAIIAVIPMFCFYMRTPALASRYLIDFGAAFAILISVVWVALFQLKHAKARVLSMILFGGWFAWELSRATSVSGHAVSVTFEEKPAMRNNVSRNVPILGSETTHPEMSGIAFNGSGWDGEGRLKCHVIVFVEDPEFLNLDLAVADASAQPDPGWIRAKIGLEFLQKESIAKTADGWRVRFRGPRQKEYQNGIQPAFIATVPAEQLGDEDSPWVLKKVSWRATEK